MSTIHFIVMWGIWWLALDPIEDKAVIVLYRQPEFLASRYEIKVNNQLVATLETKSFIEILAREGVAILESSDYRATKRVLKLPVKAGNTYFVKAYEEVDFLERYLRFQVVDAETAKKEMLKCKRNMKVKQPD